MVSINTLFITIRVIVEKSGTPYRKVSDIYCNYDHYCLIHVNNFYTYYLLLGFQRLNIYPEKNRDKTVEVPFVISGVTTKWKRSLRVEKIVESEIGFLLEFERNSSESVHPVQY